MGVMRTALLKIAGNERLGQRAQRNWFMRRAVRRFMPGEKLESAIEASRMLRDHGLRTIFTKLGENIGNRSEAYANVEHYLDVLRRITALNLPGVLSVKLTQLGLDLDRELCFENLRRIIEGAHGDDIVWIDMESSSYVDATLEVYRRARAIHANVGVCLQSYLYRTAKDLDELLPLGPAIRLVKGAYKERAEVAYPRKKDVDENFFRLAGVLLSEEARRAGARTVIATHDRSLVHRVQALVLARGLGKGSLEFQMLYGIQRWEQLRLARDGWRAGVLVSYGKDWFPWFMRRLAERPANVLFLVRNLVS
ncbi:MAG TPA: proline dehydrogenase family protein [Candidatus Acidoferrales bacterium]|nr:proline dehydrogenase family protein [Candidatus Acidoferrales bacterium]